jgi:hypothetical protein
MPTIEQEQQERDKLNATLNELYQLKAQDLVREETLGRDLSFSAGVPYFERLLKLYRDVHDNSLDGLSHGALSQLRTHAEQASTLFKQVVAFEVMKQPNPVQMRDNLIGQIRDAYEAHFNVVEPHIAYAIRKGTDFDALERQARESLDEVRRVGGEMKTQSDQVLTDAKSILQSIRQMAAEAGVAQHATSFKDQADEHRKSSVGWLWTTGGLSVLGLAALFALFVWPAHPETDFTHSAQAIYAVGSRLLVFSVVYFAILWAARNYMAQRHNYVVNKHRQNALRTFETFVKAAGDDKEVKNAVLLQAAQSIYGSQASGYLSKQAVTPPPSNIVEIIKAATSQQHDD